MNRPVDSLTPADFTQSPVWRFTDSDSPDETYVSPVRQIPVAQTDGCIVGGLMRLANGAVLPGFLGNLHTTDARQTEHFLMLSVFLPDGSVFHLARYHDYDADKHGPVALAASLGLPVEAVFPITYDVSSYVTGLPEVIRGVISAEPSERLTEMEIIDLAIS